MVYSATKIEMGRPIEPSASHGAVQSDLTRAEQGWRMCLYIIECRRVADAGGELAVPGENCFRRDDGGQVGEQLASEQDAFDRETATVVVGETQALAAELPLQEAVLFSKVVDDVGLVLIEPPGQP